MTIEVAVTRIVLVPLLASLTERFSLQVISDYSFAFLLWVIYCTEENPDENLVVIEMPVLRSCERHVLNCCVKTFLSLINE